MVPALFSFSGKSGTPGSVFARTVRKICTRGGESGKMLFNVKKTAAYIGNGLLLSVGTGNSGDFINCVVELTHDFRIGGFVIHFFSVAAGCNQSAGFQ